LKTTALPKWKPKLKFTPVQGPNLIAAKTRSRHNVDHISSLKFSTCQLSPIPISIIGQLLTTGELNSKEHQIIFRRIGKYDTIVTFHHVQIPSRMNLLNQEMDKAKEKSLP
jgi:predicted N-acyltransferase